MVHEVVGILLQEPVESTEQLAPEIEVSGE